MPANRGKKAEQWGSRLGVIFAVMGSAIGLGNFLRFPGLAAKYEGGTFMIPYFTALVLLGVPIAWIEWAAGRYGGIRGFNSSPGIFRSLWNHRIAPYFGILGLIIPIGIYMYYVYIESWCLYYAMQYLTGGLDLGHNPESYMNFFNSFTGKSAHGALFSGNSPAFFFLLAVSLLNFTIIYRGIQKGVELVTRLGIPLLFLSALLVLVRVMTLGTPDPALPERNVLNGLGFMWNPHTEHAGMVTSLMNAQMWLEAAGQVFFSLSVGFGIIMTYASYLKKDDDVVLSGTTSAAGNVFAEVALGGLITIPAAFIFLGPSATGGGTFQLGFITLPMVFEHMPMGRLFGFVWFFLLFIAAITSSISMLQPAIAFFEEGLGTGRKASVALLGLITTVGSLFIAFFSKDLVALDTFDFWIGSFLIYVLATIEIFTIAYIFGAGKLIREANVGSMIQLPHWFRFVLKYISPLYLVIIFLFWAYQKTPEYIERIQHDTVTRVSIGFILLMTFFFTVLIMTAAKRWNQLEKTPSGER